MIQVKGLSASTVEGLEKKINAFIAGSGVEVVEIKHAVSVFECTALVLYKETARSRWEE